MTAAVDEAGVAMRTPHVRLGPVSLRLRPRGVAVCVVLAALAVAVSVVTLGTGDVPVAPLDVVRTLLGSGTPLQRFAVETLRLPRLATGLLVGAALGVGGTLFQTVSRNPLGSPDVVGFNAGAAVGALIVIFDLHATSSAAVSLGAVAGGLATAGAVYVLAMRRGVSGYRLVLVGIGIGAMLQAAVSYLITRAALQEAQTAQVWLVGSLSNRGWEQAVPVAIALAVLLPLAMWIGRGLTLIEHGDDLASGLGVRAEPVRLVAVVVGVALAAVAVSAAGPIAFIALAAPQVARRLTRIAGPNVLASALVGAVLLTGSDLAAQHAFGSIELPVGVTTGVVGGGYLAWLLTRDLRRGRG